MAPEVAQVTVAVQQRPSKGRGSVTILVPAKNEEAGIGKTLDALPIGTLRQLGWDTQVVVVDGHSTDRTREIAQEKGALVIRQMGTGKGWGVRSAFQYIDTDFVVMLDADGTYPADAIPEMMEHVSNGSDVVIGSRFKGVIEEGAMSRTNKVGNRALSAMASVLYFQPVSDVCTGMWAFKRRAYKALVLNSNHFEIEAELFAQSVKAGMRIYEQPIRYGVREGQSQLGGVRTGLKIGAKLLRKRVVR